MSRTPGIAVLAVALAVTLAGCDRKSRAHIERSDDAAPVVIVQRTGDGIRLEPEVEPNDEPAAAMALPLPGGAEGALASSDDVDRYVVEVTRAAWLAVHLSGIEGVDLVLSVGPVGKPPVAVCDNGPALVSEGVPNLGASPGRYALVVREFSRKGRAPGEVRSTPSPRYRLTVVLVPAPAEGSEREPNETVETAAELLLGGEVSGYVGWRGDVDMWRIPLDGFGADDALDLELEPSDQVQERLRIVDAAGATVLERSAGKDEVVAVRGWVPGTAPDAAYAVVIDGKRSAFERPYRLRAVQRILDIDEETEPNDAIGSAITLAVEPGSPAGQRRGSLTRGDIDVYAVPVASGSQGLSLSVDRDVTVEVLDAAGAVLVAPTGDVAQIRVALLPGVRAFVQLSREPGGETAKAYTLRWATQPGS